MTINEEAAQNSLFFYSFAASMEDKHPIGVFDSGIGGLTILKEFRKVLPQYDYMYLGDNARAPYGNRSFETVYKYTLECVEWFFSKGCKLVILACNTASAKALRSIQQNDLARWPGRRVLGVLRPTTESIGNFTSTGHVGILATAGTVLSDSYVVEITKFFPHVKVWQEACPMWVPLVENREHESPGADYFIRKHLQNILLKDPEIDTILLGCTHYPLLLPKIKQMLPENIKVITQGSIVADSLQDYLQRHPQIESFISQQGKCTYQTTDSAVDFDKLAHIFLGGSVSSIHVEL